MTEWQNPPADGANARERGLFVRALELSTTSERAAFLDRACGADVSLRQRIERLLSRGADLGDFLEHPAAPAGPSALSPVSERPGDRIGRYQLRQQIGEGGCGVVYVAEQEEPVRRRVALKIIKVGMDTRSVIARFEAERQALALMDHLNIAKVLDAGATETGRPYFVMELVRGVKITDYCDENQLAIGERLELFIQVCRAVQHAHQKGIVHRDLKPSNILVTVNDGVAVPKVIDFGIAKATTGERLTDKTLYTAFEQFIGTPAYMSPEQAMMTSVDIDTRSDIYSLGVLLYELLTGKTPFETRELLASGLDALRKTILETQPPRPSTRLARDRPCAKTERRNPKSEIDRDLDCIVMKCLEKDRARRYETANGLAMDLQRHLNHEPVVARPPSTMYRAQRFVRRNLLTVAAVVAVGLAMVLGSIVSVSQAARARRALEWAESSERQAQEARARESNLRRQAQAQTYASDMKVAQQALARNDLGGVLSILNRYLPQPGQTDLRGWEWRFLWNQARSDAFQLCATLDHEVHALSVSPDGRWFATGELEAGSVFVFDLATCQPRIRLPAGTAGGQVAFAPRGHSLAYSGWSETGPNRVVLWNVDTRQPVAELPLSGLCHGLAFSNDGSMLAVFQSEPHLVSVWDVNTPRERFQLPAPPSGNYRNSFAWSWERRLVAVSGPRRGEFRVIDLETGQERWSAMNDGEQVTTLAFSSDGKLLGSGTGFDRGSLLLWDAATGMTLGRLDGHSSWISALVFWPDGKRLASASADQTIRMWDIQEPSRPKALGMLRGHRAELSTLVLVPATQQLLSGCIDGSIHLWSTDAGRRAESEHTVPAEVVAWSFGADSQCLLTLARNGRVAEWRGPDFQTEQPRLEIGSNFLFGTFSSDGQRLATGTTNRLIHLWDLPRGRLERELVGPLDEALPMVFDSGGTRLFSAHRGEGAVAEWDLSSGQRVRAWQITAPGLGQLKCALSADDRWLAMGDYGGAVKLVNRIAGTETNFNLGMTQVGHLALSRDGTRLAAASWRGLAKVWRIGPLEPPVTLGPFMHGIFAVAFSPEDRRLAITSDGQQAALFWDLGTFREVLSLEAAGAGFRFAAFSPDGNLFGARTGSGRLHLWRAPPWEQIQAAEGMTPGPSETTSSSTTERPL